MGHWKRTIESPACLLCPWRTFIASIYHELPAHHALLSPKAFYLRQRLTRVEETIAGQAVGHLDAAAVGAVEGLSLGGATVSVAREESFKGGEVGGGTATGRRRRQARKQRA